MKTKQFTEVCHLDTCLPDYFSGYSYPVIAIAAYNGMTRLNLAEEIESEINATWEYIVGDDDRQFTEGDMKLFETFCKELRETNPEEVIYSNPEETEEFDSESSYIYLSLCSPVTRYGINFLNE
jgi:hypothetical protein